MTIDELRAQIREDTNTTTNNYTDVSLIRDLNNETILVHTLILNSRGPLEFDDPNQTGYPWEDITLDGSSDTYDVQTDDDSQQIYSVHKVVINKTDVPRLAFTEGNQNGVLDTTDTATTPSGFYDLGKAIRFTEIPAAGTATIYYDRQHHFAETGDTTLQLGLPIAYHPLVGKRVARNYWLRKDREKYLSFTSYVRELQEALGIYEDEHRGDESVNVTVQTFSGI